MANQKIVATGERFIPEANDEELEIEHLERYLSIKELVRDKTVLDAACGEGYGSHILSQTAATVLGVDIDAETVQRAREKYGTGSNLDYKQASVTDLSVVPSGSIEMVVSYETIEHIDKQSQIKFLQEIVRVLKPDGILIMSTPDKKEYSDKYQFNNPFHVKEFYAAEFIQFLHTKFRSIKLYNQYLEVASFIECPEENTEQIQYFIDRSRYKAGAKYVIAIATNGELPKKSAAMAFMHLRREYMPMMEELNYCRKEAIECRKKVKRLDECLNENKLSHEELERRAVELKHRMDEINKRDKKINEQKHMMAVLQEQSNQQENKINLLNAELERRAAELEHRMDEINKRDRDLHEHKNAMRVLREQSDRQENELKLLNEELDRRETELEHRMDEINKRDREIDRQRNDLKLSNDELQRRAVELGHRMDEINSRDEEIERQKNEVRVLGEQLDNCMIKTNELQRELDQIKSLKVFNIVKWFYDKSINE